MNNEDTLFEDASGHAADMFEDIREGGIDTAKEVLKMSPEDMGMEDNVFHLLAVEALCAAAGQPSLSDECHYIREWGAENPATIDSSTKKRMLAVVDAEVAEGGDKEIAERMKARIQKIG